MFFYNNEYTLLTYQDNGMKLIKVPNELLGEERTNRTVFNYKDGEFLIDKRDTNINNTKWEKEQSKLTEEKEGQIYMISYISDDYYKLLNVESGSMITNYNFGLNSVNRFHHGDFIIMQDGKYNNYNAKVNLESKEIKEKVKEVQSEEKAYREKMQRNLKEDTIHIVKEIDDNGMISLENTRTKDEFYIFPYSNIAELKDLHQSGFFWNTYEMSKEDLSKIEEGSSLIIKDGKFTPYKNLASSNYEVEKDMEKEQTLQPERFTIHCIRNLR